MDIHFVIMAFLCHQDHDITFCFVYTVNTEKILYMVLTSLMGQTMMLSFQSLESTVVPFYFKGA